MTYFTPFCHKIYSYYKILPNRWFIRLLQDCWEPIQQPDALVIEKEVHFIIEKGHLFSNNKMPYEYLPTSDDGVMIFITS